LFAFIFALFFFKDAFAGGAKTVWVNSYTKSNGTYVSGYFRSPPDGSGSGSYNVSYGYGGYNSVRVRDRFSHKYSIDIYEGGKKIVRSYGIGDSQVSAAEDSTWKAQNEIEGILYARGMSHAHVECFVSKIFSQDSCRMIIGQLKVERDRCCDGGTNYSREYSQTCIVPSFEEKDKLECSHKKEVEREVKIEKKKVDDEKRIEKKKVTEDNFSGYCTAQPDNKRYLATTCTAEKGSIIIEFLHNGDSWLTNSEDSYKRIFVVRNNNKISLRSEDGKRVIDNVIINSVVVK